ncbi:MAG: hypothetical protein ACYTGQ_17900 [Planctomycetota bacterium]|jgi:hypothetical protein
MTKIDVMTETDSPRGWTFEVRVQEGGETREFEVTLSWAEYDLWSRGQVAPERVVDSVFVFLLQNEPLEAIKQRFDCAVIRRYFPRVDQELPGLLGRE